METYRSETRRSTGSTVYEIEVTPGLEFVAADEVKEALQSARITSGRGFLRVQGDFHFSRMSGLRTAQSVYVVVPFAIPRPRALLGEQHFRRLKAQIEWITAQSEAIFRTFHVDAAGDDTPVMQRLKQQIAAQTGLPHDDEQGDLKLRIIPARSGDGWEVLIRTTPRPLSTRWWRQHNFQGALNAAVASAMLRLSGARRDESVINLACGSGTLAIERALLNPSTPTIALDNDEHILKLTAAHRAAIGTAGAHLILLRADLRALPFANASVNRLVSDLPFGQSVGTHAENRSLYPTILKEAGRVSVQGAVFVLITHEVRLMDDVLKAQNMWNCRQQIMITLRGLHPRIYVLERG
jgi:23S rRNA G2445 N2-methylase RlmL